VGAIEKWVEAARPKIGQTTKRPRRNVGTLLDRLPQTGLASAWESRFQSKPDGDHWSTGTSTRGSGRRSSSQRPASKRPRAASAYRRRPNWYSGGGSRSRARGRQGNRSSPSAVLTVAQEYGAFRREGFPAQPTPRFARTPYSSFLPPAGLLAGVYAEMSRIPGIDAAEKRGVPHR
jgi:hypothetical protein